MFFSWDFLCSVTGCGKKGTSIKQKIQMQKFEQQGGSIEFFVWSVYLFSLHLIFLKFFNAKNA
jgi:hypothetical protein